MFFLPSSLSQRLRIRPIPEKEFWFCNPPHISHKFLRKCSLHIKLMLLFFVTKQLRRRRGMGIQGHQVEQEQYSRGILSQRMLLMKFLWQVVRGISLSALTGGQAREFATHFSVAFDAKNNHYKSGI
uniref:Uncharacterized protein n=1 Tax=Solanum lycopersicum TaxID=4081 RepID=A0A3Q7FZE4_SOLLC